MPTQTKRSPLDRVNAAALKLDPAERVTLAIDLMRNAAENEIDRIAEFAGECKRRAYYTEIRRMAEDYKERVAAGEFEDREALIDDIRQTIDGHHDVIYTACAKDVVRYSDNDGACEDAYGSEGIVEGGQVQWSRLAYAAMEADFFEQLSAEGVDVNAEFCSTHHIPEEDGACPKCEADAGSEG